MNQQTWHLHTMFWSSSHYHSVVEAAHQTARGGFDWPICLEKTKYTKKFKPKIALKILSTLKTEEQRCVC